MTFPELNEKVILVIMIMITLISLTISTYIAINQTETRIKTCLNKKIYIILAGGTIEENFNELSSGLRNKIADYDIIAYNPPIEASNMTSQDWNQISFDIVDKYDEYDAFVIVSPPDAIPYMASSLAFILENLGKPVIISSGDLSSTLVLASSTKFPEVMVANNGKLIRGCRSVIGSNCFVSPNYPVLNKNNVLTLPSEDFSPKYFNPKNKIVVLKVHPEVDLKNINDVDGIVLELWGEGSGSQSPKFFNDIGTLANNGVVIVAVSQRQDDYEIDIRLVEAGVLPGYDMTTASAYAKLLFLLGNVEDKKLFGQLMDVNFRGEMTTE